MKGPRVSAWLLVLLFGLLLTLLALRYREALQPKDDTFDLPAGPEPGFTSAVTLSQLTFEPDSQSFRARLRLVTRSPILHSEREIQTVRFSLQAIPRTQEREWLVYSGRPDPRDDSPYGWIRATPSEVQVRGEWRDGLDLTTDVGLWAEQGRPSNLYPLDRYRLVFDPHGCADYEALELCDPSDNESRLETERIRVMVADRNFESSCQSDGGRLVCELARPRFVRFLSGTLLLLSLIFLTSLFRSSGVGELLPRSLGFFGTLWGLRNLIVPKSIEAFPTLVDFATLSIFLALFFLILYRTLAPSTESTS